MSTHRETESGSITAVGRSVVQLMHFAAKKKFKSNKTKMFRNVAAEQLTIHKPGEAERQR